MTNTENNVLDGANVSSSAQQENQQITGAVVGNNEVIKNKFLIPRFVWYILAALIIVGIAVFTFFKLRAYRAQAFQHPGKITIKPKITHDLAKYDRELAHAEKKILEAQEEINRIKNKKRIEEMKKRIQEEQDELRRLEKGKT